ncbi:hypothetical protein [Hypericibacter sp.]|uniref:hypothetical protein n=1 Tax=Hypericibacter sp. TaxID=2705401 RepID=UPI003D6CD81A
MMARILTVAFALAVTLTLAGCSWGTRYQAWGWVDNNCSSNGGVHSDAYCDDYTKNNHAP